MKRLAVLLTALIAATASAAPRWAWRDGQTDVVAVPREGARLRVRGEDLSPVELQYPDGRRASAFVGSGLIVHVDDAKSAETQITAAGLVPVRALMPSAGLWLARDADGSFALDTATRLRGKDLDVTPDLWLRRHLTTDVPPDDPRYPGQWYLKRLDIESAWALSTGNADTTVVVIDNGCDADHPDLVAKMDPGKDVVSGDDDPSFAPDQPGNNHGTAVAGVIGAATDNAIGIAGACPDCRLRCVRLLSDGAEGTPLSADVDAFQFVIDSGSEVASNSWGFVDAFPVPNALATAIMEVVDNGRGGLGALVLFAAGNDDRAVGSDELLGVRGVVGVGAVNIYDETTAFTNFGAPVDVVAPTGTVTTDIAGADGDDPGDYTTGFGGTSSACPVAAGVAALLVAAAPQMSGEELAAALINTARPSPYGSPDELGHDDYYGHGSIDPAKALRDVLGLPDPVDAGVTSDAGTASGGGGDAPGEPEPTPGCACGASDSRGAFSVVMMLMVLGAAFRRARSLA